MRYLNSMLLALSLVFTVNAWAGPNLPPGFDAAKWSQFLNTIVTQGAQMQGPDGRAWRTLSRLEPADTTKPHQADYISTIGIFSVPDGKYQPLVLSAVSENWQIDGSGNWDVNQWIYALSTTGELQSVTHNHLVETKDSQVLADDTIPSGGASDPAELQHWGQKLDFWYSQPAR